MAIPTTGGFPWRDARGGRRAGRETMSKTYNGWANHETWCVHLWLSNEEGSERYWREAAELAWADSEDEPALGSWDDREQRATRLLAERLKDELEGDCPVIGDATLWADLMSAALSEVDWREVAGAFLEPVDKAEAEAE